MATKATWSDFEVVVRGLFDRNDDLPIKGLFAIDSADKLRALRACLESAEDDTTLNLTDRRDTNALAVGEVVSLEIGTPRVGFGLLVATFSELLAAPSARVCEPARYLVLEGLVSKADVKGDDDIVTRYRAALDLILTLKRSAAFLDTDEQTLVFIRSGKFEIPCLYGIDDLRNLSLSTIRELAAIIPTGTHEEQCLAILAEAATEMTGHSPGDNRFSYLLSHSLELKKRYEEGYKLFASGFSYEKVRDQVEAARVEYTGKIHKVLADIQNQLLGIPVATIIVATQMKDAKAAGYEFWVNIAVLIGCWVFAALMFFVLHNQSQTLEVVRGEIERQRRQLEKEYVAVAGNFSQTFLQLTSRAATQLKIFQTIRAFVFLGLFLSHVVFVALTAPAREELVRWASWFCRYL
ncbi:MAG TPA: hypothetical protein VF179_22035 [Thermoanaerobaculia bacterium]|nr:hypothetical protein [Thermoanaerobaculia bacterium]